MFVWLNNISIINYMFICANCRRFVDEELEQCHNCYALVCNQCILILEDKDDVAYKCGWATQLCTNCQCAGNCIKEKPFKINVGSKCERCKLQYCSEECHHPLCFIERHIKE